MRIGHTIVAALAIAAACGGYGERYPSYEAVVAQYASPDLYAGVPLDAADAPPCVYPGCPCPRIWYDAHWVYYCEDRWVYWHHDCWYYYPFFYIYYVTGVPHVIGGPAGGVAVQAPAGGYRHRIGHGGAASAPVGGAGGLATHRSGGELRAAPRAPAARPERPARRR